jgi:hypothetical protein
MWPDPGIIKIAHRHINVEIGTEAAQFPEKEYISGIFVAVRMFSLLFVRSISVHRHLPRCSSSLHLARQQFRDGRKSHAQ